MLITPYWQTSARRYARLSRLVKVRLAALGYVAERLILKPHSASGLISRLEEAGLITREADAADQRRMALKLTPQAEVLLEALSLAHIEELKTLKPLLVNLVDDFGG
ncbi:MarR family winged helix-turn-helix transcriptional regulator [Pantoea sp. SJZ147]|uniref:MarR family winged helix-turn-helix transcriptional regulator n=1 Tax=Pantoea sp. SJZ147 TaxID=2572896 RepID=UPI0011AC056C|nr:MarR family transcriptional regulator [Pantoea sp. SJZ147]TWD38198.1 MarR family protein [Pantoea sp. SJZ147]